MNSESARDYTDRPIDPQQPAGLLPAEKHPEPEAIEALLQVPGGSFSGVSGNLPPGFMAELLRHMEGLAVVVPASAIRDLPQSSQVLIEAKPLHKRIFSGNARICEGMPYADQPSITGWGSAYMIRPGLICTAAHVVIALKRNIGDARFVLGAHNGRFSTHPRGIILHKSQVFRYRYSGPLPADRYQLFSDAGDWALIEVVPAFHEFPPQLPGSYPLLRKNPVQAGEQLYSLGHGLMLPAKTTLEGRVISLRPEKPFFECDLTLLSGNSGSPVFSAADHRLVGLFMRGAKKLVPGATPGCLEIEAYHSAVEGQECLCMHEGLEFERTLSRLTGDPP